MIFRDTPGRWLGEMMEGAAVTSIAVALVFCAAVLGALYAIHAWG